MPIIKKTKEIWLPNSGPQTSFLSATAREVLYGGAVYGGKSEALVMLPLRFIEHPKHRAIILRRVRGQLQETIDRTREVYPNVVPGAYWKESESRWLFPSGAVIQMGYAEHEKDIYQFKTFEYNLICFDELTTFSEGMYAFMMLRNRTKSRDLPLWVRSGTNPGDIGHEWVFNRFIKNRVPYDVYEEEVKYQGKTFTITQQFIPSSVYDNSAMAPADRDQYIAGIVATMPAEDVAAYLGGDWNKLAGAMFKTPPYETDESRLLDSNYYMVRAIDFGINDPTCVLWLAVYPDVSVIDVVSELYITEARLDDVITHILEREKALGLRPIMYSVGSPEMGNKQATSEQSIRSVMAGRGVFVERGNTDRVVGWTRIRELLGLRALRIWPGDSIHGAPNLMRTLPKLQRNSGPSVDPNDIRKRQEDHAADALRYGVMTMYETPAANQPPPLPEKDPSKQDVVFDKVMDDAMKKQRINYIPELGQWD